MIAEFGATLFVPGADAAWADRGGATDGDPPSDDTLFRVTRAIDDPAVRVVSFDLFDTLIVRAVFEPHDLFPIVGRDPDVRRTLAGGAYAGIRRRAEARVRRRLAEAGQDADPTFAAILDELAHLTGLPRDAVESLGAVESRTELALCRPWPLMRRAYAHALAAGRTVAITSDTYLPPETLTSMLARCGYDGPHHLFASCVSGATKHRGGLFAHVAEALGTPPAHILHIGDNPRADGERARQAGWTSVLVRPLRDRLLERLGGDLKGLTPAIRTPRAASAAPVRHTLGLLALGLAGSGGETALQAPPPDRRLPWSQAPALSAHTFGLVVLGPFVLSLMLWMRRHARHRRIERLAFLARDGHLPMAATHLIDAACGPAFESEYLPISRTLLVPLFLGEPDGLQRILAPSYAGRTTVEAFVAGRLGPAGVRVLRQVCGEAEASRLLAARMQPHHRQVLALLEDNRAALRAETCADAEALAAWYRDRLPGDRVTGVFDVGTRGNCQAALSRLLGWPVHGFYVLNTPGVLDVLPREQFESFHGICDPALSARGCPHTIIYERLLSEPAPSYERVDETGAPVRRDEAPSAAAAREAAVIEACHDGALAFVRAATEAFGPDVVLLEQEPAQAAHGLGSWIRNPGAVRLLDVLRHDDPAFAAVPRSLRTIYRGDLVRTLKQSSAVRALKRGGRCLRRGLS